MAVVCTGRGTHDAYRLCTLDVGYQRDGTVTLGIQDTREPLLHVVFVAGDGTHVEDDSTTQVEVAAIRRDPRGWRYFRVELRCRRRRCRTYKPILMRRLAQIAGQKITEGVFRVDFSTDC